MSAFPAALAFMEAVADYMIAAASVPAEITPIRRKKRPADLSRARSKAARDMVVFLICQTSGFGASPRGEPGLSFSTRAGGSRLGCSN